MISYNKTLSKHSMVSVAFPGVQWGREQSTQLCKKYYASEGSLRGYIEQYGPK